MNKMNKNLLAALFVGGVAVSSALAIPTTGTINLGRTAGTFGVSGGEYTISAVAPTAFPSFQSFCLELTQPIQDNPLTYKLNVNAVSGGVSTGADGGVNYDPISKGTAWLFNKFSGGALAGYNYTPGAGREASAYGLQLAIWWLEDESTFLNAAATAFLAQAQAVFGAAVKNADNGAQGVYAMNLVGANGIPSQDMLAVPDGGVTLMLLGMGLGGIAFAARRNRK